VYTRLSDGTAVIVRPIQAADKEMLSAGLDRLSERSRRQRFLAPKKRFSAAELRYLTEVDGVDHYAIVALLASDPSSIVGVGRFVRLAGDTSAADVAIVVMDSVQKKRLGTQLAHMLAEAADARGIKRFVATALSENPGAMKLMHTLAKRLVDCGHDHGVHEVRMELAA
jgi:GNAT superfamily N-acetyltransferase